MLIGLKSFTVDFLYMNKKMAGTLPAMNHKNQDVNLLLFSAFTNPGNLHP